MTISLNVTGKLPSGLVEVYGRIHEAALALDVPMLIVGATARDVILVHGYDAAIERGTRDVDFGIEVSSWEHYQTLRDALIENGFKPHMQKAHQLNTLDSDDTPWEVDLIPFGDISSIKGQITWPPQHDIAMTVLGFNEAYVHAWDVTLDEVLPLSVKVASPAGILLLKLIAWTERGLESQRKDAADIYYIIRNYAKIPHVLDTLYDADYMETQGYDDIKASAMLLADEVASIAHPLTLKYLHEHLIKDAAKLERLTTDISQHSRASYEEADELVMIIQKRLSESNE